MAHRIVLVTGCSTGIGFSTAILLSQDSEKRFKVYATVRNLDKKTDLEEAGKEMLGISLFIKRLDVCSDESVNETIQEILDTEGRIDVLSKYVFNQCYNKVFFLCLFVFTPV